MNVIRVRVRVDVTLRKLLLWLGCGRLVFYLFIVIYVCHHGHVFRLREVVSVIMVEGPSVCKRTKGMDK